MCHEKKKMANSEKEHKKILDGVEQGDEEVVKVLLLQKMDLDFKYKDKVFQFFFLISLLFHFSFLFFFFCCAEVMEGGDGSL